MIRKISSTVCAFLLAAAAFAAAPPAGATGVHYRAEPAAAPTEARLVVRDIAWRCAGGACVAPENHSRPAVICAALAREVGTLRSFSAGGRAFDAPALENCNRRARR